MKKSGRTMGMKLGTNNVLLQRFGSYLLYGLITLLITVLYLDNHRIFATWELAIQDVMITLGKRPETPANVVVINIDDTAVEKLGSWPWDSERIGYLVGMLGEYEPKAIGLDLDLPTDFYDDPVGNRFLADMIAQSGRVVLPLRFTLSTEGVSALGAPDFIAKSSLVTFDDARSLLDFPYLESSRITHAYKEACLAAWSSGHVNSWQDVDGKLRRDPLVVRHAGAYYPSMSLQLARAALGVHRTQVRLSPGQGASFPSKMIPSDESGLFLIDYRGPSGTISAISAAKVLEGEANPAEIAGKVVVVGVSASGYGTSLHTSVSDAMPRTEKIATVTANILADRYITTVSLSTFLDILILFAIGMFCAAVLPRVTLINRIVVLVAIGLLFVNLNYVLYTSFKLITKTLFPSLEILLFLAMTPLIKPRRTEKTIEEMTGGHISKTPGRSTARLPAREVGTPSSGHIKTRTPMPSGRDGVPARHVADNAPPPAGVISGLAKTMVIDLDSIRASGAAESPPAGPETTPPADLSSADHALSEVPDIPDTPAVDDSIKQSGTVVIPQPQPRDLMGQAPKPMGLSDSAPQEEPTDSSAALAANLSQLGRYEILGVLGEGAMGTVYKGLDPAIDRMVALKTIRVGGNSPAQAAELSERLVREAKAAGKLSHPHIVTIYDVGCESGLNYIAMEYLEGYTLEQLIKKGVQVNYRIAAKMLLQVCDALEYAHAAGIIHRDIKPANIMVLDNFETKVTDFGIARFDSAQASMTQTGIAVGTPQYIAPEQLRGEEIDRRSDIFSLGVVAYELLTRRRPFTGDNISQLVYAVTQTDPAPPSQVDGNIPRLFDMIIGKALAKDRRERYQSAREMQQALSSFVEDIAKSKSFRI